MNVDPTSACWTTSPERTDASGSAGAGGPVDVLGEPRPAAVVELVPIAHRPTAIPPAKSTASTTTPTTHRGTVPWLVDGVFGGVGDADPRTSGAGNPSLTGSLSVRSATCSSRG